VNEKVINKRKNNRGGIRLIISKSNHPSKNKKPRLESINLQSGYETHAGSSILNWLEDEWASNYSIFFDSVQFHAEYRMNEVVPTSTMLKNM